MQFFYDNLEPKTNPNCPWYFFFSLVSTSVVPNYTKIITAALNNVSTFDYSIFDSIMYAYYSYSIRSRQS